MRASSQGRLEPDVSRDDTFICLSETGWYSIKPCPVSHNIFYKIPHFDENKSDALSHASNSPLTIIPIIQRKYFWLFVKKPLDWTDFENEFTHK